MKIIAGVLIGLAIGWVLSKALKDLGL